MPPGSEPTPRPESLPIPITFLSVIVNCIRYFRPSRNEPFMWIIRGNLEITFALTPTAEENRGKSRHLSQGLMNK